MAKKSKFRESIKFLAFAAWPPFEAAIAAKYIDEQKANQAHENDILHDDIYASVTEKLKAVKNGSLSLSEIDLLYKIAEQISESEKQRRISIESKAQTYNYVLGVAVTIVSLIPATFSGNWELSAFGLLIVSTLLLLAVVHFLMAAFYSVKVRQVSGIAVPNPGDFRDILKPDKNILAEQIALIVSRARYNESVLTIKANNLSITESMFLRGILFLSMGLFFASSLKVLNI